MAPRGPRSSFALALRAAAANGTPIQLLSQDELEATFWGRAGDRALFEVSRYALSAPGKQLRPRLAFEAARCGPRPSDPCVREAAKAVELVHLATLVHDDVIDDSPLRRGNPTLGSRYGAFGATTTGGWLFASAIGSAVRCGQEAAAILADTVCALCDGQMLETQDLFDADRSVARYDRAIAGKTASLFACAARLGAIAAGARDEDAEALGHFGHCVGMAYQVADDVLDLVGKVPGKRPGDDLLHGIFTLPVIYAVEVDPELRERLAQGVGDGDIASTIDGVERAGGVERAVAACRGYADAAVQAVGDLGRNEAALRSYVERAVARCLEEASA